MAEFKGSHQLRAEWFDCRTDETNVFAILPNRGQNTLVPPTQGKSCDWVMIMEEVH